VRCRCRCAFGSVDTQREPCASVHETPSGRSGQTQTAAPFGGTTGPITRRDCHPGPVPPNSDRRPGRAGGPSASGEREVPEEVRGLPREHRRGEVERVRRGDDAGGGIVCSRRPTPCEVRAGWSTSPWRATPRRRCASSRRRPPARRAVPGHCAPRAGRPTAAACGPADRARVVADDHCGARTSVRQHGLPEMCGVRSHVGGAAHELEHGTGALGDLGAHLGVGAQGQLLRGRIPSRPEPRTFGDRRCLSTGVRR
jgi:hypothetical protein